MDQLIQNPWLALALYIWTLPWKGVSLWKAANRKDKVWFVALLLLNTFAIVEILYIFVFSDDRITAAIKNKFYKKTEKN